MFSQFKQFNRKVKLFFLFSQVFDKKNRINHLNNVTLVTSLLAIN